MTVYYPDPDETLWDVAKCFHVLVSVAASGETQLPTENPTGDGYLIVVSRCRFSFTSCQLRFHEAGDAVFIKQRGGCTTKLRGGPSPPYFLLVFACFSGASLTYLIYGALRLFAVIFKQFIQGKRHTSLYS